MFCLTKMSSEGFRLYSESLSEVCTVLFHLTCKDCVRNELPEDFHELSPEDAIDHLLATPCGAEFMLEYESDDPYLRKWSCEETPYGYNVTLEVGCREVSEVLSKHHWDDFLYPEDMLRCCIQRLQREMIKDIFPLHNGRFKCDWEL